MKFTAHQIAALLNGEIVGDENAEVHTLSKIEEGKKGLLHFYQTQNIRRLSILQMPQ